MLDVKVHAANIHDTSVGDFMCKETLEKYPSIKGFCADGGYRGTTKNYVEKILNLTIDISKKIKDVFAVIPVRWVVERTFAWINNFRRLAKDFEILTRSAENFIRIAMIRITLCKLF